MCSKCLKHARRGLSGTLGALTTSNYRKQIEEQEKKNHYLTKAQMPEELGVKGIVLLLLLLLYL